MPTLIKFSLFLKNNCFQLANVYLKKENHKSPSQELAFFSSLSNFQIYQTSRKSITTQSLLKPCIKNSLTHLMPAVTFYIP